MKKIASIFLLIICGCGPVSEFVKIKLDPRLPTTKAFPDFQRSLTSFDNKALDADHCYQKVYAGFSESATGGGFRIIDTRLTTFKSSFTGALSSAANFIAAAAIGIPEPIIIEVPRNKPVRVGMMGVLFSSSVLDTDGNCVEASAREAFPFISSSPEFIAGDSSTIGINLKIIKVTEAPDSVRGRDFVQLHVPSGSPLSPACATANCDLNFTFGDRETGKSVTVKGFSGGGSGTPSFLFTLPKMYPITATLTNGTNSYIGKICELDDSTSGFRRSPDQPGDLTFNASFELNAGNCTKYPGNI